MMIQITSRQEFHLSTEKTSYLFRALPCGKLEQLYYGRRIPACGDYPFLYDKHAVGYSNSTVYDKQDHLSLDHIRLDYSEFGKGDYRLPAMQVQAENGNFNCDFKFLDAKVTDTKPELSGLPSSYGRSKTLTVILEDPALCAQLHLFYTVFEECNVITRSARLINQGEKEIKIHSLMSMQIDLPAGDYTMLSFDGSWIRERYQHERKLTAGECSIGSICGTSSNRHNPFFAIRKEGCNEQAGECWGFNLVYSGNHIGRVEVAPHGMVRVQNGINPFEFEWALAPGQSFDAPESVLTFSHEGLNGMSRNMHAFVKEHIVRGEWKNKERPIVVNNWEATYFTFTEKKILAIAKEGARLGAELFVLDDGWFGKRNSDHSSLGDWWVNKKKLPSGIGGLAKKINDMGLKFGLWVEPEMVNPDSDLYRAHPDWAMTTDEYEPTEGRNQLVLDLTNPDVQQYLIDTITDVIKLGNIEYIKWDMNRQFSDVFGRTLGTRQGEYFHRYYIGLSNILQALCDRFPHVLFESCSSGGNRFDLGMFCYMPQCWTSDNTDPLDRVKIQSGTSYGYPQSVMTMHVSASPSFASLRASSIEERFNVASFGLMGYELDVTNLSSFDRAAVKKQIAFYKAHRRLLQFGEFYRIGDPFKDNTCAWQVVSPDQKESMLGCFLNRLTPNSGPDRLSFVGLDPEKTYRFTARQQLLNLRTFGEIINTPLPKKFDMEDGKVYNFLTDHIRLHSEREDYTLPGASLLYAGLVPCQLFVLSGYNGKTRVMTDTDSRVYYLKEATEEELTGGADEPASIALHRPEPNDHREKKRI